jgi:hypothetical protein
MTLQLCMFESGYRGVWCNRGGSELSPGLCIIESV